MLHDRRQRHREGPGKLAYRNVLALVELREQGAPRGIGEGGEGAVERGLLILNHVVKCRDSRRDCQSIPGWQRLAGFAEFEADDVECEDGEFKVTFDKDFNITSKEKDEY